MTFIKKLNIKLFENLIGKTEITDISKIEDALNIKIHELINEGSFAKIFSTDDPDKIVKITSDLSDYENLLAANRLIPNYVPKIYGSTYEGVAENNIAMLIEHIEGTNFPLITNEMLRILQGNEFESDYKKAMMRVLRPKGQILNLLNRHNLNDKSERIKLANLIKSLGILENHGIEMLDFDQNIIDDGQKYVIIDLGEVN